ncbi:hypothetical protein PHLGIDRAFT_126808 [Phlebiopsis gigantea 11061_1 CR5-6]|uniref:Uncharacterized protein n=1 Tax=Phlebiopsis gigantea (strain 11061_1 CR5-6) TaxID=745531 RepID=A0A0C3S115_PHLG1|nr:hypothetical protein PHLGIDRAFT_126808 [Phlebiopsis gigantea 11061_1 CR5-6]
MATASPASQFSVLLRRSKFASYDTTIGQVYTSHGGHLHRGNWGFKRPLPIRRRGAYIMVNSVDSKEEQTEWKAASREGRFMKMWDEVAVRPDLDTQHGSWAEKLGARAQLGWSIDTEFIDAAEATAEADVTSQAKSAIHGPVSTAVPNIYAMSEKEFDQYIAQLRKSRPAYLSFLRELAARKAQANPADPAGEFSSAWDSSFKPTKDHRLFLGSKAYNTYNSTESRSIEQQPQHFGGLVYSHTSALQSHLLRKPKPAHVTISSSPAVSFAGLHADVANSSGVVNSAIDFNKIANNERNPTEGVGMFKFKNITFTQAPEVVSKKPQNLFSTSMRGVVVPDGASEMERSNTHWPGSPAYVGHNARKIKSDAILSSRSNIFMSRVPKPPTEQEAVDSETVLNTLNTMLGNKPKAYGPR